MRISSLIFLCVLLFACATSAADVAPSTATSVTYDWLAPSYAIANVADLWYPNARYVHTISPSGTDSALGGAYLHLNAVTMFSRFHIRPNSPSSIELKIRQNGAGFIWLNYYLSEAEYFGIIGNGSTFQTYFNAAYSGSKSYSIGSVVTLKIAFDGDKTLSAYVNGVFFKTLVLPSAPTKSYRVDIYGDNADIGPVTVTGDQNVWVAADAEDMSYAWDNSNVGVMIGNELRDPYGSYHFEQDAGGLTILPQNNEKLEWYTEPRKSGTFWAHSPVIHPATGYKYGKLALIGKTNGTGTLTVQVRDSAGNAIGSPVTPTATTPLIDLSAVTADGIYLDVQGNCTVAGTTTPPVLQYAEISFMAGASPAPVAKYNATMRASFR